jgi:hypothetical protein
MPWRTMIACVHWCIKLLSHRGVLRCMRVMCFIIYVIVEFMCAWHCCRFLMLLLIHIIYRYLRTLPALLALPALPALPYDAKCMHDVLWCAAACHVTLWRAVLYRGAPCRVVECRGVCFVVWCGVVWYGVPWCAVVCFGVLHRGVPWRGVPWCAVACHAA